MFGVANDRVGSTVIYFDTGWPVLVTIWRTLFESLVIELGQWFTFIQAGRCWLPSEEFSNTGKKAKVLDMLKKVIAVNLIMNGMLDKKKRYTSDSLTIRQMHSYVILIFISDFNWMEVYQNLFGFIQQNKMFAVGATHPSFVDAQNNATR
jgi:hypothetical protein